MLTPWLVMCHMTNVFSVPAECFERIEIPLPQFVWAYVSDVHSSFTLWRVNLSCLQNGLFFSFVPITLSFCSRLWLKIGDLISIVMYTVTQGTSGMLLLFQDFKLLSISRNVNRVESKHGAFTDDVTFVWLEWKWSYCKQCLELNCLIVQQCYFVIRPEPFEVEYLVYCVWWCPSVFVRPYVRHVFVLLSPHKT